ncbi:MAG: 50S ribosomal protein L29 [Alphaproteobacteria bacterium ADurb.Bin438]|nr:MAG: 50S ribosomal protein L29 [Alphaproteobacteria bacterium ADurb.Bin438]
MNKVSDLRAKSDDELKDMLTTLRKQSLNLRINQANGQLKDTSEKGKIKKDIAMIKTLLTERQKGINSNSSKK